MRILLTNDDGINAPGLEALEKIARELSDDVWVVAPEQEQSGAGHSLTLHVPVRVRELAPKRYAVSGTPTDCVLLAVREIIRDEKIDLVLSGVNRGSNVADDITYSGTVAAAMEAALLGIPAVALSQLSFDDRPIHWETAVHHAPGIIRRLKGAGWPADSFVNINFPACAPGAVKGIAVAPQGKREVSVKLTLGHDPRGRPYYWLGGDRNDTTKRKDIDVARLIDGFISVTPIQMDMTDYPTLERFKDLFSV